MAIRCIHHKEMNDDGYYNWNCIPYEKRLPKGEKNKKYPEYKDHPCPFMDFAECNAWMEGEKYRLFEEIWTKKYDSAFFYGAKFIDWCRRIEKIPNDDLWKFMRTWFPDGSNLKFIGYPDQGWTDKEKLVHKLELTSFTPLPRQDPPNDVCLNESCSCCSQYIVCPMVHNRRELLAYGVPEGLKKTRSYTRWRWHLNKAKSIEKEDKEQGQMWRAKTIWFILRQIEAEDFASGNAIVNRGFVDMRGQGTLPIIVDRL